MRPVVSRFPPTDADHYDAWFEREPGRSALALEKRLLQRVWSPCAPQRILEVGCGTGRFLEWFASQGHQATGLESSPSLLIAARNRLPSKIHLELGDPEDLPYEDNAYDTVALLNTLEFVNDPLQALTEACRVARSHVLLGALNKYSFIALQRCWECWWRETSSSRARFFSVFELRSMARKVLQGAVPIHWKTCLFFPLKTLTYLQFLEKSPLLTWHPFGHFIAMRIDLRYPLQTAQNPVFSKITSGVREMPSCSSCWRLREENPSDPLLPWVDVTIPHKSPPSQKEMLT